MTRILLLSPALLLACNGGGSGGDGEWSSSDIRIDAAGAGDDTVESDGARLCRSTNGNLYAVWYDDREGGNDVWFQVSRDGGFSWASQAIRVNRGEGEATWPDIACVGNTVFVVWEDTRDGELENKNVYFNRSDSAGTRWLEEDVLLDADPDGDAQSIRPRIVSAGDEVHVAWADANNGAFDIYTASSTNRGSAFGPPVRVNDDAPGSSYSASPQLIADGDGNVMLAWEDSRNQLNDIYFALSQDSGASWGANVRLDGGDAPGSSDSFAPALATGGGHVYVTWHDERNGGRDIFMNWSADGGATWATDAIPVESTAEGINAPGTFDALYPQVAMTGTTAHLVWQDRRNGGFDIYYRSFVDGAARELEHEREVAQGDIEAADGEIRLDIGDQPGFSNAVQPRIAVRGDTIAVAWEDRRFDGQEGEPEGFNELYYNYSEDGGLSFEVRDDFRLDSWPEGRKYATDLQIRLGDDEEILALWQDGRRGNSDVFFANIPLGETGTAPPSDAGVGDDGAGDDPDAE
jgi:hypothetical protein